MKKSKIKIIIDSKGGKISDVNRIFEAIEIIKKTSFDVEIDFNPADFGNSDAFNSDMKYFQKELHKIAKNMKFQLENQKKKGHKSPYKYHK